MKTKILQKILSNVKPALAKKEILEQATHFIFTGNQVLTYNDQICIMHPLETSFKGSAKADDLYKIISGITDDEVDLVQDKDQLKIVSKSTKAGLALLNAGEKDIVENIKRLGLLEDDKTWSALPEDFISGMFLTMFAASRDQTQGPSTCVFVSGKHMWAGDEIRIGHYSMQKRMNTFLLPASSAVELAKFDVQNYAVSDSWVHFITNGNVIFNARRMSGEEEYPDLTEYFEVEGKTVELPESLKSLVDSVSAVSEAESELERAIEISIVDKKIRCRAQKEKAWIEKEIETELDIKASFNINPIFLSQILEKTRSVTIGEDVVKFQNNSFEHVIALKK